MGERKKRKDMRAREREREVERGRKSGFINLRFDFFAFVPKEIKSLPKPKMNIQTSGHRLGTEVTKLLKNNRKGFESSPEEAIVLI